MNYNMFVLTTPSRERLARILTESVFQNAAVKPDSIIVCSMESIPTEGWHSQVKVLSGVKTIKDLVLSKGLSKKAWEHLISHVVGGQMFLKYIIPRLCMSAPVLVSDDDVYMRGPCTELFENTHDFLFMDDPEGYYGQNSIDVFLSNGWVKNFPAYRICAGFYMAKRFFVTPEMINELVLRAQTHRDEQSAVGMELDFGDYDLLLPPKYIHGGYVHRRIPDASLEQVRKAELIHMQSRFAYVRDLVPFVG